ncbi:MAG: hypothetical protein PUC50_08810 [Bacteroidales bacterium]|nr:hypothetical protein [Bacteroidales bacterium]
MKKIHILFLAAVAIVLSSCFATRTTVGDFNQQTNNCDTNIAIVSKTKQCYAVYHLVPLGLKHAETPPSGNCQIKTMYNPLDMLVSMCTANLFSMKTIKVWGVASEGYTPYIRHRNRPVISNGIQWEFEANTYGGSLALSYKFAKRFSIGVGYGAGAHISTRNDDIVTTIDDKWDEKYKDENHQDKSYVETESTNFTGRMVKKLFFTGQIRPWDKRFSPIVGANLGWQTLDIDGWHEPLYGETKTHLYVTPYIGFSIRCGSNCYISMKAGWNMVMGKLKPEGEGADRQYAFNLKTTIQEQRQGTRDVFTGRYKTTSTYNARTGRRETKKEPIYEKETYTYMADKEVNAGTSYRHEVMPTVGISSPYLAINFTHTLPIGAGLHTKAAEKVRKVMNRD